MAHMGIVERPPGGPRGSVGAAAEEAAARHLVELGWSIVARNVRVGSVEVDVVAIEPGRRPTLVVVEVRSRSGPRFGSAVESVDGRKVARLYRAALALARDASMSSMVPFPLPSAWRVDLLSLRRGPGSGWAVEAHLRGLASP